MKTKPALTTLDSLDWPGERRLFLGILPDAANASQLVALLPQIVAPAKPVAASNLHLTLLFLGQSSAMQARQVTAALGASAAAVKIDASDLNADIHASATYRANLISVQTQRAVAQILG